MRVETRSVPRRRRRIASVGEARSTASSKILGRVVDQEGRGPELLRAAQVAADRGALEHDGA